MENGSDIPLGVSEEEELSLFCNSPQQGDPQEEVLVLSYDASTYCHKEVEKGK
jgi:hypothetical protein